MRVYYFAYGSCMDEEDFRRTVPDFESLGRAVLNDYRLAFSKYGHGRQGGVADIIPYAKDEVQGVLYTFADQYLDDLDRREGVPEGMYERFEVAVWTGSRTLTAYTYQIIAKEEQEIQPSPEYVRLIWNGLQKYATDRYREQFAKRVQKDFGLDL